MTPAVPTIRVSRRPWAARRIPRLRVPAILAALPAMALLAALLPGALPSSRLHAQTASEVADRAFGVVSDPRPGTARPDAGGDPVTLERSTERRWIVRLRNEPPRILHGAASRGASAVRMPGYRFIADPGAPELPYRRLQFAAPAGAALRITIRSVEEERWTSRLTPIPGNASRVPDPPDRRSTPDGADGAAFVTVQAGRMIAGVYLADVAVTPVLYDVSAGTLRWARTLEAVIDIVEGAGTPASDETRTLPLPAGIVNAADAAAWSAVPAAPDARARSAAPAWFNPGERMLRIRTRDDGVYRLTRADFEAAGIATAQLDPARLQLWRDGVERPLLVTGEDDGRFDDTDTVYFHVPRLRGAPDEHFHPWTDEAVSFIGMDAAAPMRYHVSDPDPAPGARLDDTPAAVQLEVDSIYHLGDHEYTDMTDTERAFGEGWIWRYLLKKDSLERSFDLPAAPRGEARVRIRTKSSSVHPSRVRVTLNGTELSTWDLDPYLLDVRDLPVPGGLLRRAGNRLVVTNVGIVQCPPENPVCTIERVYVDWASVQTRIALQATDAAAPVLPDSAAAPGLALAEIGGFPSSAVRAFNPGSGAMRLPRSLAADGGGVRAGIVLDADSAWIVFSPEGAKVPAGIETITMPRLEGVDADYLVVTHERFRAPAERLAAWRRQKDGFRTAIAVVDDIYIAHNGGIKDPVAIRRYVRDVWDRSAAPKPRFLILIGDASWDPKFLQSTSFKHDWVPTYGNPVSDNYYVMFGTPPYEVTPGMAAGRIPAETAADADAVIDKIIEYESLPPNPWDNRVLFSIGGESYTEQQQLIMPPIRSITAEWLRPYCMDVREVYKTTFDQGVTYDDLDTLVARMNEGTWMYYFSGHGGSRIIDVGVERPDIFSLRGRYPFFVTMSCNTAHFAEPYETGLNERFAMEPRNGSIASYGTSGLGEVGHDFVLSQGMLAAILDSGYRTYGEMSLLAKTRLVEYGGIASLYVRNTVNQYIILGDPATRIPLARGSELLVRDIDIATVPGVLRQQEAAAVTAVIRSAGTCLTDSVDVRLDVRQDGRVLHTQRQRIAPFLHQSGIRFEHDFAGLEGAVELTVTVDPDGRAADAVRTNNAATIFRTVLPRGITPILPLADAVIDGAATSLRLTVANPSLMPPAGEDVEVEFQFSPDPSFAGGTRSVRQRAGDVFTSIDWTPDVQAPATLWWRARIRTAVEEGAWSAARALSFETAAGAGERLASRDGRQWEAAVREHVVARDGGLALDTAPLHVAVASGGFNNYTFKRTELRVDGVELSPNRRGFNVAVLDPVLGSLIDTAAFDTYLGGDEVVRMTDYLRAVPDTAIVLIAVLDDANGYFHPDNPVRTTISAELRAEFHRFGATRIDSLGFRDSYALIGVRSRPERVREMHLPFGAVFFSDTFTVRAREGRIVTAPAGAASAWTSVSWSGAAGGASSSVTLQAWAVRGEQDSLVFEHAQAPPGVELPLAGIDAARAPLLRFAAVLRDGTGLQSPVITRLDVRLESKLPELGVTSRTVLLAADSVLEGEPVRVRAVVHNGGRVDALAVPVRIALPPESGSAPVTAVLDRIPAGGSTGVELAMPTAGIRGETDVTFAIDAERRGVEYHYANNAFARSVRASRDGDRPRLHVLFDGVEIVNNDHVSPTPVIEITLRDASPLPVTDTSAVQLFLDGRRVWLVNNPEIMLEQGGMSEDKVRIRYTPALRSGTRTLAVSGRDASGNAADSIPYQVRFLVSADNGVDNVYPWPNPSPGRTEFTFRLRGSDIPERARIRIYTVAGRFVRELEADGESLRIGFNRIPWDGRDGDGDLLANGVYFYRLVLERGGDLRDEHIGRVAILR